MIVDNIHQVYDNKSVSEIRSSLYLVRFGYFYSIECNFKVCNKVMNSSSPSNLIIKYIVISTA